MYRALKVSTLIGVGFVAGVLGMCQVLKDGAITTNEDGSVRVNTTPSEYFKNGVFNGLKNFGKDEKE